MAGKLESAANADTMRGEKLVGRTQQMFFSPEEDENFLYPDAAGVDFDKKNLLTPPTWTPAPSTPKYAHSWRTVSAILR